MATLYLIRHGEPELRGVLLGQLDPPLSPKGHRQVGKLDVAVTYSSPLLRARQTAQYIGSPKIVEIGDLREIDYGEWSGKTWAEIEEGWPHLARRKSADWLGVAAPGGELWSDLIARVGSAWNLIRQGPEPCAVVAHQGVNAALASLVNQTDPLQFTQQYGEVIRLEYA